MQTSEALWSKEIQRDVYGRSPDMHDYFAFMREAGWFEDIVGIVLGQMMDHLATECVPQDASLDRMKLELVRDNPRGVADAVFRFVIDDTLEKMGSEEMGPIHWATAAYFWFKWKEAMVARMMEVREHVPGYVRG